MKPKLIDAIRDLAVQYENKDKHGALELMTLALKHRPSGPFIKAKVEEYRTQIQRNNRDAIRLTKMIKDGNVAIIPIGFRCHTAMAIKVKLGISQPSLPFNSGFFSPHSVARLLTEQKVDLNYHDNGATHTVCTKTESNIDSIHGRGIKFETKGYDYINDAAKSRDQENINHYLDSTFGYYTLDRNCNYVLAHYNWHSFSDDRKSKGITDPAINLRETSEILSKRIDRMMRLCNKAEHIFFIFYESQKYNYIQIDNEYYFLDDFSEVREVCDKFFGDKYTLVRLSDINSVSDLLSTREL